DYKPEWHENTTLELLWWGIPIAVISILAVIAWNTSHSLDPYKQIESDKAAIKVQVVALQWKWLFIYPQLGVATVNKLPIPEKTPIHFTISADAPMSAFWVPTLGSQIYAMNGMSTQLNLIADRTGEFTGVSSNINGKGYADMKFTVYSKTEKDFNEWVKSAQNSANMLDRTMYERLAQPGVTDEATYMLTDASLYDTIVNKYMHGMSHGSSDSGTHVMPDGTVMKNSDMQKQEHMEGM
ncbi:MAG: COX aromatic rich motif-containing protein, partial [Acidobacteriota bacterium]